MDDLSIFQQLAVWSLPVLFAITVHEVAHGWMASRLGDLTALRLGRVTLNPLKHIDPVGTLLVPGILLVMGSLAGHPFIFGWAKPVPVDYRNLGQPKRDMAIVALAGPLANLLMALLWGVIMKAGYLLGGDWPWAGVPLTFTGLAGIIINSVLMVLNLLPLPPLDGGRILVGLLPVPLALRVARLERYGFMILLVLLASGALGQVMSPLVSLTERAIITALQL